MGLAEKSPETGEIVARSDSAAMAQRIRDVIAAGAETFVPEDSERGTLLSDVGVRLPGHSAPLPAPTGRPLRLPAL
jgi:hypothetical protein